MYKIMNRRITTSESWEETNTILPSGYIRKGALQVFHRIRRSFPEDHIVCIGYNRGDTQFAITETFKTYDFPGACGFCGSFTCDGGCFK